MGDISIQHGCPEISSGQMTSNWTLSVTVRRSVKRTEITTWETRTGDRTQFGVLEPPDQSVIHSPGLHQCLSTNGMTPDDLHLGDLQSPALPPANSFDRPRQSTSPREEDLGSPTTPHTRP